MASPIDPLVAHLKTKDGLTTVNVSGMRSQVVAPALILRPDEPWLVPNSYCKVEHRYVAVATASAATPDEAVTKLLVITTAVVDNLPEGWDWESVGAPILDESTGTTFIVAPVRLIFKGEAN